MSFAAWRDIDDVSSGIRRSPWRVRLNPRESCNSDEGSVNEGTFGGNGKGLFDVGMSAQYINDRAS